MPRSDKPSRSALRRTLGLLRPHLHGHGPLMAGGVVALLFEVVFRVLEPWPLKFVIDALTRSLGADLAGSGPTASWRLLLAAGAATVAIVGMRALANYLATVAFALAGSRIATALRARVFAHVARLSRRFHSTSRSGDLVQRLIADVGRLQEVAVTAGLPMLANVVTLVAMTVVMFFLDWLLAVVVIVASATFVLTSRTSTSKITTASRKTRQAEGDLANIAQETVGAISVVQAYGLEGHLGDRFQGSNAKSLRDGVKSKRLAAGLERRTDLLIGLATAAVLVFGGWRVMTLHMTPGDLVIFTTYLKTAMKPLRDMAKYTGRIARATASGERVADVLDVQPEIRPVGAPRRMTALSGALRFSGVTVRFQKGHEAVSGVDLEVVPGERVAFVGHSGSGKSTLASLIPRLIDPTEGVVLVDGVDVRTLDVGFLRSQVALVQQEAVLFTGTVLENIRMGRLDATDEEVVEAAKAARAHDFIMAMPDGYRQLVGERGGTLSGGQRQRISIARALLRDARIIVLDEVTTGLDGDNADAVLAAIDTLTKGRTTIVVTHDEQLAAACDWVFRMERGRVVWQGAGDAFLEASRG